jgi:DNA-binding CsgD family transcriptional regulator
MTEPMSVIEPSHVLTLIEEAHVATTAQALRKTMIYGVGALIESASCAWTELDTGLFSTRVAPNTVAVITDELMNIQRAIRIFNQYAHQHPVITRAIKTEDTTAQSISDLVSRAEFNQLELYRLFYRAHGIEDQLSIAYVDGQTVVGLSVNRTSWGFTHNERDVLSRIARCVFPFHRILQRSEHSETRQQPVIEANTNTIALHSEALGITPREADLLTHVACGKSNKQIAEACGISEGTVRKHLENAYRRLGVNNRMSAITKSMAIISQSEGLEAKPG